MKIFTGNSIPILANNIAKCLCVNLEKIVVNKFSDGEINVKITNNINKNDNIFVIQSTCTPTNDNLMELFIIIDALRRTSTKYITAVIPYFGYARQDRKINMDCTPITAKMIANFLVNIGINHIITVDIHSDYITGFFDIPVNNISSDIIFSKHILEQKLEKPIIVSPDIGSIKRAKNLMKLLKLQDIAIINKYRPKVNIAKITHIIGDVNGKDCILLDDILDTGCTLCAAAKILKEKGAKRILVYITHPIFSGNAYYNIANSVIDEIIVCDSIPLKYHISTKVKILTLAELISKAIIDVNSNI